RYGRIEAVAAGTLGRLRAAESGGRCVRHPRRMAHARETGKRMTDASRIDLGALGLDRGAHLLIKRALRQIPVGAPLLVSGSHEELAVHLRAWCRAQGHEIVLSPEGEGRGPIARIVRGSAESGRWKGAEAAGAPDRTLPGGVVDKPPARWGLAARGAKV